MAAKKSKREGPGTASRAAHGTPETGPADLAPALAEAAAGLPGAAEKLAAQLTPTLQALLHARLATADAAGARPSEGADPGGPAGPAGQTVQQLWHQIVDAGHVGVQTRTAGVAAQGAGQVEVTKVTKVTKATKAARATEATEAARTLYPVYVEHAARALQSLVQGSARDEEAVALLGALQALEGLDARLARNTRLRWFGGLGTADIAQLQSESVDDAERDWQKARAFLSAAAGTALAARGAEA